MSDLAATNCGEERSGCGCGCGCDNDRRCGCDNNNCNNGFGLFNGFGGNSCCSVLWIIILLSLCGNNGYNNGYNNGNGDCCWIIIVLLLLCGGCF